MNSIPEPDEVLELAQKLKNARSQIRELETQWNELFAHRATSPPDSIPLKVRIMNHLSAYPSKSFTAASLAGEIDAKENSVGPYLSILVNEKKIERRERGLYGSLAVGARRATIQQKDRENTPLQAGVDSSHGLDTELRV